MPHGNACATIQVMYARRLTLALAALACAAVLEGMAAMWALSVEERIICKYERMIG